MSRILYAATVASHIRAFHLPFIEMLRKKGHIVEVACRLDVSLDNLPVVWNIPFSRTPYSLDNLRAYNLIKKLIKTQMYDLIHVHTPVASFIIRLAAKKSGIPVLYTAHGFHFYKGAPLKNWLIYYNMERLASRWTTALIVVNKEDLQVARGFGLVEKESLFFIRGIGIDAVRYGKGKGTLIKQMLGLPKNSKVVLCVAEFTPCKNHIQLLRAWPKILASVPQARLLLAGEGKLKEKIYRQARYMGLLNTVTFLGYRTDIPDLLAISEIVVLTSRREGMPRALMEAMAAGKPIVATDVRGSRELIESGQNGFLVPLESVDALTDAIIKILQDQDLARKMGESNRDRIKPYSLDVVLKEMEDIYTRFL